jgi:hypothetical protein
VLSIELLAKSEQVHGAFGFMGKLDRLEWQVTGNNWEQRIQVMLTCWARSGASTNTHMGMSYVQYGHGKGSGMFASSPWVKEERSGNLNCFVLVQSSLLKYAGMLCLHASRAECEIF